MKAVQMNYNDSFGQGFNGQIFNPHSLDGNAVFSYPTQEAVFIGCAVATTAAQETYNTASASAIKTVKGITDPSQMLGILVEDKTAQVDQDNRPYLPEQVMASVLRRGSGGLIQVNVTVAVAADEPVYVATASVNAATIKVGQFTNLSGNGLLDTGMRFFKGCPAGDIAIIDTRTNY